jgi:type I restriction enzyme S subunit
MGPFGSSIKVETLVPEGVPVISGQHLNGMRLDDTVGYNFITPGHADRLKNANVQRGDVVLTHRGNIGQVAYIPAKSKYDRYAISQSQFYLRPDPSQVLPEFIVAYFKTLEGQHKLLANTSQVGVPSIAQPVTYLRTIEIPLPPLPEQRAIAHILGTLDDKIELNRRMSETLEAMARALFKSWFVDFEPVRAKMEGRWRRGESLPGLPAHLYDLFPDRLVDSELGAIPEGWQTKAMREAFEIVDGRALPAEFRADDAPFMASGATGLLGGLRSLQSGRHA